MQDQNFQLVVNGVPYIVKASPFEFNADTRYRVSFNGSDDYTFAYDPTVGRYTALGDDTVTIPDDVEVAIAGKLSSITATV